MGFIETLNKYGKKVPITKTNIFKKIEESKSSLESLGLDVKLKSEFDLFDYEIIYNGLLMQHTIENAYELFINKHYDVISYLNYEEKRIMFNNDIQLFLEEGSCFFDEKSQTKIYIPYLEPFVNKRYTEDYQIFSLKQHRDYMKSYKIHQNTFRTLYDIDFYCSAFTSLENVYEDERHICFYYEELKAVFILKKDDHQLLNKVIIQDADSHGDVSLDNVKAIMDAIENYRYQECMDILKNCHLISDKTYKKVLKKYR